VLVRDGPLRVGTGRAAACWYGTGRCVLVRDVPLRVGTEGRTRTALCYRDSCNVKLTVVMELLEVMCSVVGR
jgi:hypothetical protein